MARHDELWIPEVEQNRWSGILIRTLIIVAVVVGIFFLVVRLDPPELTETERGVQRLKELEAGSVNETENAIASMRQQVGNAEDVADGNTNLSIQMQFADNDIMLLGDSLAAPMLDYGILDDTEVVAERDASVDVADEMLSRVYAQEPWNFVLAYGLNDVLKYGSDVEGFINSYLYIIEEYHAMRPNSAMFICGVTRVTTDAMEQNPQYRYLKVYDEAIRRLCKQRKIQYISVDDLVGQYADDGVLPQYSFYTGWAQRILEYVTGETTTGNVQVTGEDTEDSSDEESGEAASPGSAADIYATDESQYEDYGYDEEY